MKIGVIGTGYVGLVTGTCFAEMGNSVICMDADAAKVAMLQDNRVPIYEPGLDRMIENNVRGKRLSFTNDLEQAVRPSLAVFIAVGTPPAADGSADLTQVFNVARAIGDMLDGYKIVVTKSTVPVGTGKRIRAIITEQLEARGKSIEFDVVSNPEFLKEGSAIADCMKPDRVIVGTDNVRVAMILKELYRSFMLREENFIHMDLFSAELTKYAANAMLATKISFMNEIASICERVGANVENIRLGIGSDTRIGYSFIYPGLGYGGSCFPKDVKALISSAEQVSYRPRLLRAVEDVNEDQKLTLVRKIVSVYGEDLSGKIFSLWGLSFKPDTDDIREAPALTIIDALLAHGARVRAFDPVATENVLRERGSHEGLSLHHDQYEVLDRTHALLIATEWKQFRNPDFEQLKARLVEPRIFDGRNMYPPEVMAQHGFSYHSIGR